MDSLEEGEKQWKEQLNTRGEPAGKQVENRRTTKTTGEPTKPM